MKNGAENKNIEEQVFKAELKLIQKISDLSILEGVHNELVINAK